VGGPHAGGTPRLLRATPAGPLPPGAHRRGGVGQPGEAPTSCPWTAGVALGSRADVHIRRADSTRRGPHRWCRRKHLPARRLSHHTPRRPGRRRSAAVVDATAGMARAVDAGDALAASPESLRRRHPGGRRQSAARTELHAPAPRVDCRGDDARRRRRCAMGRAAAGRARAGGAVPRGAAALHDRGSRGRISAARRQHRAGLGGTAAALGSAGPAVRGERDLLSRVRC
jgi:hypothetical protein